VSAAADARAFVDDHELGEHVGKVVADAPELSAVQRDALRAILSPNMTKAAPDKAALALTDDHRVPDGQSRRG
jgi:hypothetical protein